MERDAGQVPVVGEHHVGQLLNACRNLNTGQIFHGRKGALFNGRDRLGDDDPGNIRAHERTVADLFQCVRQRHCSQNFIVQERSVTDLCDRIALQLSGD